jgi:hypothetical protein
MRVTMKVSFAASTLLLVLTFTLTRTTLAAPLAPATTPAGQVPTLIQDPCGRGWVYFDLGNTLVDTHDWTHLRYMTGSLGYIHELKAAGFHLAIVTNVPESWGTNDAEKIAHLKSDVNSNWQEPASFEWDLFESILVPPTDQDRKPAPYLFEHAKAHSVGCKVAFEGEDPAEVIAAEHAGFNQARDVGVNGTPNFIPAADLLN